MKTSDVENAVTPASITPPADTGGKICQTCNSSFVAKRSDAKFCSSACRQKGYRIRASVSKRNGVSVTTSSVSVTEPPVTVTDWIKAGMIRIINKSPFSIMRRYISFSFLNLFLLNMINMTNSLARTRAEVRTHLRASACERVSIACHDADHAYHANGVVRNLLTTYPSKSAKMSLWVVSCVRRVRLVAVRAFLAQPRAIRSPPDPSVFSLDGHDGK
jgi:hypothetical protein